MLGGVASAWDSPHRPGATTSRHRRGILGGGKGHLAAPAPLSPLPPHASPPQARWPRDTLHDTPLVAGRINWRPPGTASHHRVRPSLPARPIPASCSGRCSAAGRLRQGGGLRPPEPA